MSTGGVRIAGVEVEAKVGWGYVCCSRIAVLINPCLRVVGWRVRWAEDPCAIRKITILISRSTSKPNSPDRLDHWLYIATLQEGLHPLL